MGVTGPAIDLKNYEKEQNNRRVKKNPFTTIGQIKNTLQEVQ